MEEVFDVEKWRIEQPMDYIKALDILNSCDQPVLKNEVFRAIYEVTRLHIPDVLYKYYSLTNDIRVNELKLEALRNQKIYMSDSTELNDPFDGRAFFYNPNKLIKHERLECCEGNIIDDFTAFYKLTSFTLNGVTSMPMWAHYSGNHNGYCVSYDMKEK